MCMPDIILCAGRTYSHFSVSWDRKADEVVPEVATCELWDDLVVDLLDSNGVRVIDGPDADTALTFQVLELNTNNVSDVKQSGVMCDASGGHSITVSAVGGRILFPHAICRAAALVTIRISDQLGNVYTTVPFKVSGQIPVGIGIPEEMTSSTYQVPYRAMKMLLEQTLRGAGNLGPHVLNFGATPGYEFHPIYVNTAGTPTEALEVRLRLNLCILRYISVSRFLFLCLFMSCVLTYATVSTEVVLRKPLPALYWDVHF